MTSTLKLKRMFRLAAAVFLAVPAGLEAEGKLSLKVMTASPGGFLVTSTLISGEKDAVLIDGQFTLADAHRVTAEVLESGKNLTAIYVTHFHPDHYFGLEAMKQAFPHARIVALPATVAQIQESWREKLSQWKPMYGANLPVAPVIPMPLDGKVLMLEGEAIEIVGGLQGDAAENSYVWVPSLKAAICGDIVFNGVFPWTKETDRAGRKAWLKALNAVAARNPAVVVAGHKVPSLPDDPSSLAFMKDYLAAYDKALASSKTAEDFTAKMKASYPSLALEVILTLAAEAHFPAKK